MKRFNIWCSMNYVRVVDRLTTRDPFEKIQFALQYNNTDFKIKKSGLLHLNCDKLY